MTTRTDYAPSARGYRGKGGHGKRAKLIKKLHAQSPQPKHSSTNTARAADSWLPKPER